MPLQTYTWETGDYAYKSWSNGYKIHLTLTEESTSIENNTSVVSYRFWISNGRNNRFYDNNWSWSISIGGHSIAINNFNFYVFPFEVTQTIASDTIIVDHKADGSLDMPFNVSIPNVQASNATAPPAMSLSGTWALTKIPRVSTVYCPNGTIDCGVNIEVTKADGSLTHTLTYSFGNLTGTIAEKISEAVVPWNIPADFYSQIPNASSGYGSITCTTYSGEIPIGTDSTNFYAYADEGKSRPVFTEATITETSEVAKTLTGNDPNKLIRYISNAEVTAKYELLNSASLKSYTLINNGKKYDANPVTIPIDAVGCGTFSFTVVDKREFTTDPSPVVITKEIVPYVKLTCNLSDNKPDVGGHMDVSVYGNCFKGSFGAVDNELTVKYRYKVSTAQWLDTDEEWHTMDVTQSGDSYTASASLDGLEYQTAYTFQAQAEDKLGPVDSNEYTVKALPVFDWGENDFNVNGEFKINNQKVVDYIVEQGIEGSWTYRKWASGIAECWCLDTLPNVDGVGMAGGLYRKSILNYSLPFGFVGITEIQSSACGESRLVWGTNAYTNSDFTKVNMSVVGIQDFSNTRVDICFSVKGKWK